MSVACWVQGIQRWTAQTLTLSGSYPDEQTSLWARMNGHMINGIRWVTERRSNPTWEIRKCLPRKVTIQTSPVDIRRERNPRENTAWLSDLKTIRKCDPIWQLRNMKLKKTMQLGQGHLASEAISQVPRLFCSSSVERQRLPDVPIR